MKHLNEFLYNKNFYYSGYECKIPIVKKGYGCTVWKDGNYIGGIRGAAQDLETAISWAKNIVNNDIKNGN